MSIKFVRVNQFSSLVYGAQVFVKYIVAATRQWHKDDPDLDGGYYDVVMVIGNCNYNLNGS